MDAATPKIQVVLSFGLLLALAFHALATVTMERALPSLERRMGLIESTAGYGINFDEMRSKDGPLRTLPVNTAAASELKKQVPCVNCPRPVPVVRPQPVYPQPVYPQPVYPAPQPAPMPVPSQLVSKPTNGKPSIALFVAHTDSQSQSVLNWFNEDRSLQALRQQVDFTVYTRDNQLYRSRYASAVPESSFPTVLFVDGTGGHIAAFDRTTMPRSASQLYADLKAAHQLQQQVVANSMRGGLIAAAAPAGEIPPAASSSSIGPDGRLCPDGNCEREPLWKRPTHDGPLFPNVEQQPIEGLLRLLFHPVETMAIIGVAIVAVIVCVYFVKRSPS